MKIQYLDLLIQGYLYLHWSKLFFPHLYREYLKNKDSWNEDLIDWCEYVHALNQSVMSNFLRSHGL